MEIRKVPTDVYASNCYLVISGNDAVLIDPSATPDAVADAAGGTEIRAILLTHGHFDHMLCLDGARERTHAPLMLHRYDVPCLSDASRSLFRMIGYDGRSFAPAERILENGDVITLGDDNIRVIHTPGHTAGSVCYLCGDSLITGDTLFDMGVGRCDFPSGDGEALNTSLRRIAKTSPDARIYPGHGAQSDMAHQIRYNPYLKRALL